MGQQSGYTLSVGQSCVLEAVLHRVATTRRTAIEDARRLARARNMTVVVEQWGRGWLAVSPIGRVAILA
jgi:hypothetical protein